MVSCRLVEEDRKCLVMHRSDCHGQKEVQKLGICMSTPYQPLSTPAHIQGYLLLG